VAGRRRVVGYIFSALTAWHRPSTGISPTVESPSTFAGCGEMSVWAAEKANKASCAYKISTMDSVSRYATHLGMIVTHEVGTVFWNGDGMSTYILMLSTAMGAQYSLMFSQSNISLAAWAGFDTRMDKVWMAAVMERLTYAATAGIAPWINLPSVIRGWDAWDEDVIFEYYSIDPFNNRKWLSYSPYPHYYVQQWSKKLQMVAGEDKCKLSMIPILGEN